MEAIDYGAVGQYGADVTLSNTAAGIVNQGSLATIDQVNTPNIVANAVNSQIVYALASTGIVPAFSEIAVGHATLGTDGGYVKVRCSLTIVGSSTTVDAKPKITLYKGAIGGAVMNSYGNLVTSRTVAGSGGLTCVTIESIDTTPGLAQQYTVSVTTSAAGVEVDGLTHSCGRERKEINDFIHYL